jgi:hypothetical protein
VSRLLAIDPGNVKSAYVIMDTSDYSVMERDKVDNDDLLAVCRAHWNYDEIAVEMIQSYGMTVGIEVFETCVTIGRIVEIAHASRKPLTRIKRQEVKLNLCHDSRAKDANITQALIDRFAPGARNMGKGTAKEPGWFYGFKADIWQAYAVGVTHLDRIAEVEGENEKDSR